MPCWPGSSIRPASPQAAGVTANDLIVAMNTLRVSYGHPALVEDPIIDAVAQSTAEIMAANHMSWHLGNVSGRLASAGYSGGAKIWGTENCALGSHFSILERDWVLTPIIRIVLKANPSSHAQGPGDHESPRHDDHDADSAGDALGPWREPCNP